MAKISLEIVTPDRVFFKGDVDWVNLDLLKGKEQILPEHIAFVSAIVPSIVKVKHEGTIKHAVVSGGFLEFEDDKALVLADSAEWPEEIDLERAEAAQDRAKKRLKARGEKYDVNRATLALRRATVRIKAANLVKR